MCTRIHTQTHTHMPKLHRTSTLSGTLRAKPGKELTHYHGRAAPRAQVAGFVPPPYGEVPWPEIPELQPWVPPPLRAHPVQEPQHVHQHQDQTEKTEFYPWEPWEGDQGLVPRKAVVWEESIKGPGRSREECETKQSHLARRSGGGGGGRPPCEGQKPLPQLLSTSPDASSLKDPTPHKTVGFTCSSFSCPLWCSHYAHPCIPTAWPRAENE